MVKPKVKKETEIVYAEDLNPFKNREDNNPIEPSEIMNPDDLFTSESGEGQNTVVRELFSVKNPKLRSEFKDWELKILAREYEMSRLYYEPRGIFTIKKVLDEFVLLRYSKDRQSRKEFVEAHKETLKNKEGNMFSNMFKSM